MHEIGGKTMMIRRGFGVVAATMAFGALGVSSASAATAGQIGGSIATPSWTVGPLGCRETCWYQDVCASGKAELRFQADGNLVVYDENRRARWASHTAGNYSIRAQFQSDGNLVLVELSNPPKPIWSTRTSGHPEDYIDCQNDGNVVIYGFDTEGRSVPIWATGTQH
jgi:hypothetical protein